MRKTLAVSIFGLLYMTTLFLQELEIRELKKEVLRQEIRRLNCEERELKTSINQNNTTNL